MTGGAVGEHRLERLVNLVVALLDARRPLTFEEIRRGLHAYRHDDPESARRQFERDKAELRALGIPIETVEWEGRDAYRVDRRQALLRPVALTTEEVAALLLAVDLSGHPVARVAAVKLSAVAPTADVDASPAPARLDLDEEALEVIATAATERRRLRFTYRDARGNRSERRVDPYRLALRRGRWYLLGYDHDRGDLRLFRIDRIDPTARPEGPPEAFTPPPDVDVEAHLEPVVAPVDVRLLLDAEVAWEARTRGAEEIGVRPDGRVEVLLRQVPPTRTLAWVLGLGARAEVLEPAELRAQAATHFARMVGER